MKLLPVCSGPDPQTNYQHAVKLQNTKRAFDLIRSGRCTSRVELTRETGLSATAVSSLVEALSKADLINETGSYYSPVPGRRAIRLQLNVSGKQLPVFSLNSRGIHYTLFDLGCNIIEQFTLEFTENTFRSQQNFETIADMLEDILLKHSDRFDRTRALVIGVSFPGIYLDNERLFSGESAMNLSFSEDSMRALAIRIGVPVLLGNVSMCLAYAEQKYCYPEGEAGKHDLIFINICDGVGAGIVFNGDIMSGPYDTAGEIGHISIDCNGLPCRCGNRGCLERYINQNAILERVSDSCRESGITPPTDFSSIAEYLQLPFMAEIIEDIAQKLAAGIFSTICATGIQRIVLGGGIEIMGNILLERTKELILHRHILSEHLQISYAHTTPKEDGLGLALYYLDKEFSPQI